MAILDTISSLFQNSHLIGLDIGSDLIKVCCTVKKADRYEMTHFRYKSLKEDQAQGGDISVEKNMSAQISNSIFEALHPLGLKNKKLSLGGAGSSVIVKHVSFPKGPREKILEECIGQLENFIHYPPEDVHLNFIPLKNASLKDAKNEHFLIVAISKEHIFEISEIIYSLGYVFSVMDVEAFALANCFEINYGVFDSQIVLVNIGSNMTNVAIVEKGDIIYSQDMAVGGEKYTSEIATALRVSFKEAEALKISYSKQGQGPGEIKQTVEKVNKFIQSELTGNLNFFQNQNPTSNLSKIYLTGGSSSSPGLTETLSQIIPCEKMDPFLKIKVSKAFDQKFVEEIRDICAISLGLSLRKVDDYD